MSALDSPSTEARRVAVLAGGESDERAVSLQSGDAVLRALRERGHSATLIDPRDVNLAEVSWHEFDVAFLALHGRFGEDGQVQEFLESVDIPYTGSRPAVSRLAFSKSASKERFHQSGVPTPPYVVIHETDDAAHIQRQAKKLGFPLVVKPDAQGSSLGVGFVRSPEELPRALAECFHYDAFGIMEQEILGTEWTVAMLNERILPVVQIAPQQPFYNYRAKYEDEGTAYLFEFSEPASTVRAVEETGRRACEAVGTTGIARVDIRVDRYRRSWVLEVNTIPGLTNHSLVPKAAAHAGMSLGELCEAAIHSCLAAVPVKPGS